MFGTANHEGEKPGTPKMIVGLGNPGARYAHNRHNVGFQCIDMLAEQHGLRFDRQRDKALLALGHIDSHRVILVKPITFMNDSGVAVAAILRQCRPLRTLIGQSRGRMIPIDYVLQDFSPEQEEIMTQVRDRAVQAIECWLRQGIEEAMNAFNGPSL